MPITANSMIEDVARYLSDYDEDESYVHWSREDLLSYFRKATNIVVKANKSKFIKKTTVQLKEGILQDVPESCESDIKIYGVADENGVVKEFARRTRIGQYPKLGRPICKGRVVGTGYTLSSYEYDEDNPRQIIVDPPVPEGVDLSLVISCYMPPEVSGDDDVIDLGADNEAAIFELMLYYAWGVDIEDTATRERSNIHWNNAMTLMRLSTNEQAVARRVR